MELDAFKCRWFNRKPLVLADFHPLKGVLNSRTLEKYSSFNVVDFSLLGEKKLFFYLRLTCDLFLEVVPLVVIGSTLVLVFRKEDEQLIKDEPFKSVVAMEIR